MFGIAFTTYREGETGGQSETFYLRTYRCGGKGDAMRGQLKAYHQAMNEQNKLAGKIPINLVKATKVAEQADSLEALEQLADEQARIMQASEKAGEDAVKAAETLVGLALEENYSAEDINKILDQLTDRELHAVVGTIELGEMPKDFFQSLEARRKLNTTGPSGGTPARSSSQSDTPGKTSKSGK